MKSKDLKTPSLGMVKFEISLPPNFINRYCNDWTIKPLNSVVVLVVNGG